MIRRRLHRAICVSHVPERISFLWNRYEPPRVGIIIEAGCLPVGEIVWLLGVFRTTRQVLPTEEQVWQWTVRSRR